MIDKNFVIPPKEISKQETEKRMNLLPKILELFKDSCNAIIVGGSLAVGKNYSIHPNSDIDIVFLITKNCIDQLQNNPYLSNENCQHYLDGYSKGIAYQFTTDFILEGIRIECHFWDKDKYFNAIKQRLDHVMRFRSSNTQPSINYGFGFAKQELTTKLPTHTVENWFISPFPLFIRDNNTFFPCRGITCLLATPLILKGENILKEPIDLTWRWVTEEFKISPEFISKNSDVSIANSIPGNWKFTEETKVFLSEMTKKYL
jgi:hypothetical protein